MPVTYTIDKPSKFIHTRCVGEVSFDEVIGHFDTLIRDPDCPDRLDVLLDMSEMTSIPESEQLWAVARKIEATVSRVRFGRCAIVAVREVLFGMTRMFEAIAEGQFSAVRAFRSMDEAQGWLTKM
ncbi:MAG TPA: STAS/SEC14 domain-containing protein [Bacteroidota bacterium]|nr:STAS/SEC14 domain-containing protein [Bacteroidota bacterium]